MGNNRLNIRQPWLHCVGVVPIPRQPENPRSGNVACTLSAHGASGRTAGANWLWMTAPLAVAAGQPLC
jgi:hypothetical protein